VHSDEDEYASSTDFSTLQEPRRRPASTLLLGLLFAVTGGAFSAAQFLVINWAKKYERAKLGCTPDFSAPPACTVWKEAFDPSGSWLVSFGIGAFLVTSCYVVLLMAAAKCRGQPLPSFHWQVMRGPGFLAGTLWSIADFFIVLGVAKGGNSIVMAQTSSAQLLTSGLWGLLYYKEIKKTGNVVLWCAFALLTLAFMLLLQHEKVSS